MRALISLLVLTGLLGCDREPAGGPPRVVLGSSICATCGMSVNDAHYAAATRTASGAELVFDSIECLVMHRRTHPDPEVAVWLSDHPSGRLYPAADLTVVRADFPSPMGKGYAAFLQADQARAEASRRGGRAGSLDSFLAPEGGTP